MEQLASLSVSKNEDLWFQKGRRTAFLEVLSQIKGVSVSPSYTPLKPLSDICCEEIHAQKKEIKRLKNEVKMLSRALDAFRQFPLPF